MNIKKMLMIGLACTLAGSLLYMVQHKLLIIHIPLLTYAHDSTPHQAPDAMGHKTLKLYFNRAGIWHHEDVTAVWDEKSLPNNLTHLLKQWLQTLYEEKIMHHHVSLESLAISSMGNEAYISFDRSLFSADLSIAAKWVLIESLFKTIRNNNIPLHTITLLVHHQPMHDDHLDFSQPLPLHERL